MQETEIEIIQRTAIAMYVAMETLSKLHVETEIEGNEGPVISCAHCSALADAAVVYPCPTVQILFTDFLDEANSDSSESAESEELSS